MTKRDTTANWQFWIDVGGTFTDCIARQPDGRLTTHKLLSSGGYHGVVVAGSSADRIVDDTLKSAPPHFFDGYSVTLDGETLNVREFINAKGRLDLAGSLSRTPSPGTRFELHSGEEAPITGIRRLMGKRLHEDIGPVSIRLGTTRGTNALLERQGARTAFITTRGFRDVLRIGYQNRPKLFDLQIRKPAELYENVLEVNERIDREGNVITPIVEVQVRSDLQALQEKGITSLAVCLMNAYRNPVHEDLIAKLARELGFEHVSSCVTKLQKLVSRGDTTVVDAYLTPIIRDYVSSIRKTIPQASLQLMTSAGGLVDAENFVGKDSILSGPAGGVVGAVHVAQEAGFESVIGFDMGGTSTDVCHFDGRFERRYEMVVNDPASDAGVRVVAPMLAIETVAAGGGSICSFDGQKPVVGPRSAGADPGPACYGKGGPLCVTDVNLFLGKILPKHFAFPLDLQAVEKRLRELVEQIALATGQRYTPAELASGFTKIANANMAAPIKKISLARGHDVRECALVSFGGAGAQHACAIARELGIKKVLQHPFAGILSALGIGMADVKKFAARDVSRPYGAAQLEALEPIFTEMEGNLHREVREEGIPLERITSERILAMRYVGQESTIPVPLPPDGDYLREFERSHQKLYGFQLDRQVEIYAARIEVTGNTEKPPSEVQPMAKRRVPTASESTKAFFDSEWRETAVFLRDDLRPGDVIEGPAIVVEKLSTVVVEPGWECEVTARNYLVLTDLAGAPERVETSTEVDAITLELFNNRFAAIAEQMGATLEKTALSTNVKERLDFSCAIFNPQAELVVNAPHIPVHLGAMSETVKCLMEDVAAMQPGDVFITNDPYRGGSHLPDVTVVTPIFGDANGDSSSRLLFFTASRAHHAEIGGITPGSMPPFSKNLAEEGVLIRHFRYGQNVSDGEAKLRTLLTSGPYPSRSVNDNIADIHAQIAANQTGAHQLLGLVERYGLDVVHSYMRHIQHAAEHKMRAALRKIPKGVHAFTDHLDDGTPISVKITVDHESESHAQEGDENPTQAGRAQAFVDFTGTGPVSAGNLNANRAIVTSAVLYCFRCLIEEDIPLNAGVLAPIEIRLPPDCILNPPLHSHPADCAAVVGGNVETSQRVVDVILGALGVAAASQGTMNNFIFGRGGDDAFGYYETIGGGAGAGPEFHGADAVHTHMTNTRLTDPEVLEDRYPVRLKKLLIRAGSGGNGQHRGGDGIVRGVEFLQPVTVSLLTQRRTQQPYGLQGGEPGSTGQNLLRRRGNETQEELPSAIEFAANPGDVLTILTPGGGGYGRIGIQKRNPPGVDT